MSTVLLTPTPRSAPGLTGRIRAHPLAAYVVIAYAISWTLWAPSVLGVGGVGTVLFFAGVLGPAAAALVVTRAAGGSVTAWAAPILRWRVPLRYYAYALGLPALLLVLVNAELALLGESVDLDLVPERLPEYAASFLLVLTVGGALEEPGWRGFALPRLQERHTPLKATLVLGLIWGLWHLPLYGLGFVGPMVFAFYYTWLYNRTGSVLLCILLHASFTPALDHLVLRQDNLTVDLALTGTLLAGAVALVALTRGRLGLDRVTVPDPTPTPVPVTT